MTDSLSGESLFTEDEGDLLGEVVNIAMGRAGAALAEAFSGFVNLRVPEIRAVNASVIGEARARLEQAYDRISIMHQEFFGELAGHIAVIFGPASYVALRNVLGFDDRDGDGRRQREELLLELGNALASTCVSGIGSQLGMRTGLRAPRVVAFDAPSRDAVQCLFGDLPVWRGKTLQIDIVFHLEEHDVPFELVITVSPECLSSMKRELSRRLL